MDPDSDELSSGTDALAEKIGLKFGDEYLLPVNPDGTEPITESSSGNQSGPADGNEASTICESDGVSRQSLTTVLSPLLKRTLTPDEGEPSVKRLCTGEGTGASFDSDATSREPTGPKTVAETSKSGAIKMDELPCPFRKILGSKPLVKGMMVDHQRLMTLSSKLTKTVNICPLCVQKCSVHKHTTYDLLMHVALHKGVKNLHCLCMACGRFVGRYMEKSISSTNVINAETYTKFWLPDEPKWQEVCRCAVPKEEIVFDCCLDIKCFLNLVLAKMRKLPNLKIEVFLNMNSFKDHLESHKQVWLASSVCEVCSDNPLFCHYRHFKGQYIAVEDDACLKAGAHQGLRLLDYSVYCRMISRLQSSVPIQEDDTARFKRLKELRQRNKVIPESAAKSSSSKSHLESKKTPTSVKVLPKTQPVFINQFVSADSVDMVTGSVPGLVEVFAPQIYSIAGSSGFVQKPVNISPVLEGDLSSMMRQVEERLLPLTRASMALEKFAKKRDLLKSFPKLRCPAFKDGCQFSCWHLKLMDAHLKSHLERVGLSVMFACICNAFYHNLFDFFLHILEKHSVAIKEDVVMSEFVCISSEFEENSQRSLNSLLFETKQENGVAVKFQSFTWINQLLVASGFIRKMIIPDQAKTKWWENAEDIENWVREETAGIQLYRGLDFNMRFEDVPFLDPFLIIAADKLEDDLDYFSSLVEDEGSESMPLTEDDHAAVIYSNDDLKDENCGALSNEMHILGPLLPRPARVTSGKMFTNKGLLRRPGVKIKTSRYISNDKYKPVKDCYKLQTRKELSRVIEEQLKQKKNALVCKGSSQQNKNVYLCKQTNKLNVIYPASIKSKVDEERAVLPAWYKLPANVNRCQDAYDTYISIMGMTGHNQVKIIQKHVEDAIYYQCPYCSECARDIFPISHHMTKHHKSESRHFSISHKKDLLVLCRHCDFVTFSMFGCWLHFQDAHNATIWPDAVMLRLDNDYKDTGVWKEEQIGCFVCQECGWNLMSREELISHMRGDHPHSCPSVKLGCIWTTAVTSSVSVAVWVCMFCPEILGDQHSMSLHVCSDHSHERLLYVCMYCKHPNVMYYTKSLVGTHYNQFHCDKKPFWCSFTFVGDLDTTTYRSKNKKGSERKNRIRASSSVRCGPMVVEKENDHEETVNSGPKITEVIGTLSSPYSLNSAEARETFDVEIKEEPIAKLPAANDQLDLVIKEESVRSLAYCEVDVESLESDVDIESVDEILWSDDQAATCDITSGNTHAISEENLVLVMSSEGQEYYVPKDQIAQLMQQSLDNT